MLELCSEQLTMAKIPIKNKENAMNNFKFIVYRRHSKEIKYSPN